MCKMYMVLQLKFNCKIKLPLGHRLAAFSKLCSWCPVEFLESTINKKMALRGLRQSEAVARSYSVKS